MPIDVVRIRKDGNRSFLYPSIVVTRNMHSGPYLLISKDENRISGKYNNAHSVYDVPEIDTKINSLNNSINKVKEDCNKEIADSLTQIQKDLITLKKDILSSKTFRESIKNEILQELRELNITNS